jgi:hypothetical protein
MDNRSFLYAPNWVKTTALLVLVGALCASLFVGFSFIGRDGHEDWILASISLAQVAASGLVISLIVFYSERDVSALGLQRRAEGFFYKTLPRAFSLIDFPVSSFERWEERTVSDRDLKRALRDSDTEIEVMHRPGELDSHYRIAALGRRLVMRVQVNVSEFAISYYFPADSAAEKDRLAAELEWAFSRLLGINGYAGGWYYSTERFDGRTYASIHLSKDMGPDFLEDERKKLYVANEIAANTRGILKDCIERGVRTAY